jgi:hypothetical protein
MEEKRGHIVQMQDRKSMLVTAVKDVDSFNNNEILLITEKGNMIIKDIVGLENYKSVVGGAFITCNHFSAYDNYAVWRAIKPTFKRGKRLYKIIREGNYTNFKGLYGFFFRHCNTLPLSSNTETMKKFLKA